ncbi:MAG: hypothetical protein J6U36_08860 [Oscillospiraceae bacterium]|nr:hypothetical protein [Oscillospiraceae bacterium]
MKTKTAVTLFLTALLLTGFAGCGKGVVKSTAATSAPAADVTEASAAAETLSGKDESKVPAGIFKAAELIKVGEHTYYPAGLFNDGGRNEKYKDYMLSQLEKADKQLHDDVYVHGVGEAEEKDEYRFFGNMMNEGVIYDKADMTCWYEAGSGSNVWNYDSNFRRTDFSKSGLRPAEDFSEAVFEKASSPEALKKMNKAKVTEGTYLLFSDAGGRLFYRFTVNKHSIVEVDAKTGEFISERYWNGRYT